MITDFPQRPFPVLDDAAATAEPALLGGPPVIPKENRRTPFPIITKEDLFQMMISQKSEAGRVVSQLEEEYGRYVGAGHAIATASGTASLHLALAGVGIEPGDEVIVPAFTFIATAQAIVAAKAIPVFVDIDPETYCLDPEAARRSVTKRTRAIMPVHVHGLPADLEGVQEVCARHDLRLVEDASHAHSATLNGKRCGSLGDAAGQSLMADKNFPVGGEGGMAFFRAEDDYRRALRFLDDSGIDYRMSWVAAAFGLSQLRRLPYYDEIRARNAAYLGKALTETDLFSPPFVPAGATHAFNMYRIGLHPEAVGLGDLEMHRVNAAVQRLLVAEGVPAREWQNCPIPGHLPFQTRLGFGRGYPFSLSDREDLGYDIERFPEVLRMLESTLVLCRELRSPIEHERVRAYALAFRKVANRPDIIREVACAANAPLPYRASARLG
jgi:perosamine synthetase